MKTKPPEKCENCGYASRYSRQQPGEVLRYCGTCRHWMCAGCVEHRECLQRKHVLVSTPVVTEVMPGVPANDGLYAKISDLIYHSDPDSLSSSGARLLLPPSTPAHFRESQDTESAPKRTYDFGHAAHKMVLGEGGQLVMLDPAKHGLTKEGKVSPKPASCGLWIATAAKARNEGKIPLPKSEIQKAQRMAGQVYAHPLASKLLLQGTAEVSGYWHDDATGVRCRFRPDYLPDRPGRMICVDYKTAEDASQAAFERACAAYGYHIQDAWYREGLRETEISDDAGFVFIVQEKKPPFLVNVFQLEPEHVDLGRRQMRRAIETFADCRDKKDWPGYGSGLTTARLPGYAVKRIEGFLDDEISTLTEGYAE
jgi:hypothetical protein